MSLFPFILTLCANCQADILDLPSQLEKSKGLIIAQRIHVEFPALLGGSISFKESSLFSGHLYCTLKRKISKEKKNLIQFKA